MNKLTPAKDAKRMGCKSLAQVAEESQTSRETLRNWFYERYFCFVAVCEKVARENKDEV